MSEQKKGFPIRVLCVDDEHDLLDIITKEVSTLDFEVITATSVNEAWAAIEQNSSRLAAVISDLKMPDGDGLDLRRRMMEEYKAIPFIILSGYVNREIALQGIELKISSFIEKPFSTEQLLNTLTSEATDRIASIREEDELLEGFIGDARSLLDEMESLILFLEEAPQDPEATNRIFACAHTIKGASGYFKPDVLHRFTHRFEDYLSRFKKNPAELDSSAISVFLKSLDILRDLLQSLGNHTPPQHSIDELVSIFEEKSSDEPKTPIAAPTNAVQPKAAQAKVEELRVSLSLLDEFMEKSGELTVLRNMINKVIRVVEQENPANTNVTALVDLLSEMHKANSFIQDQIIDLRKIPLRQVYKPLTRTVRDLCVQLKKPLAFHLSGEDLRVDHTIADILNKCLIHMLRNAADHGIESPEARVAVGKSSEGTIRIQASSSAEEIIVKISDDGRGIDAAVVRDKAIEKKLITPAKAEKMTESALQMLIFEPGFSTAEQITDVSGRGVGTDMVMKTVQSAGGRIEVLSKKGEGSEFILYLPIPKSVLIISSLLIRTNSSTFAIPQDHLQRVIKLDEQGVRQSIRTVKEARFLVDEEGLLPIVSVEHLLKLTTDSQKKPESSGMVLVAVKGKAGTFCLEVDEILDIEDTVVKRIGHWLQQISVFSGATFLGDGHVGLVLDIEGISHHIGLRTSEVIPIDTKRHTVEEPKVSQAPLLLFDIGTRASYGVFQTELFRLEEFRSAQVQFTGDQPVIIYRGQVMPLITPHRWVEEPEPDLRKFISNSTSLPVLVVQQENKFFGFLVYKIRDLAWLNLDEKTGAPTLFPKTYIVQNMSVTLISLQQIVSNLRAASPVVSFSQGVSA